ncbi:MAG: NAD-binding protein [Gemmatimonadota bacterium]
MSAHPHTDSRGTVLVIGSGHLAFRITSLASAAGHRCLYRTHADIRGADSAHSAFDDIARGLQELDIASLAMAFLVDDRDEYNLELLIALISLDQSLPIVASLFNENMAPHLQAAHPNVRVLNPAKIAAPTFVSALTVPLTHTLRYVPAKIAPERAPARTDGLIRGLVASFALLLIASIAYFHAAEHLSWLNAVYFVVVTVATVGYGDITLVNSSAASKLLGIALILGSTFFIWMIFSLTVDSIIKRRVQLALGRKRYLRKGHVIICGLGRLGYFIAEQLIDAGETVLIVEREESSSTIEHFRARGADVYIGDARLPRVLQDVGVTRAKALYSVVNNDFANLEIGLNARSFAPDLRLILRIFDESMSRRIKESLDIHLTFSMTAIADEIFFGQAR